MLSYSNNLKILGVLLSFLFVESAQSEDYRAIVRGISVEADGERFKLNADIDFGITPTAKEALQKGIVLTWRVLIKVEKKGWIWDFVLEEKEIKYKIKNHALLGLYSVDTNGELNMFSTLNASLNAMSRIRGLAIFDQQVAIHPNEAYQIAIKVLFDREALPIPLRPISYFNSQWTLSSRWTLWQLQK